MAVKTKAAVTEPVSTREVRDAAVRRVLARRKRPVYREFPNGLGGVTRMQLDTGAGEFEAPRDLDEYLDDLLARCAVGRPACDVIVWALEVLRGGPGAAGEAVALAGRLDGFGQFAAWMAVFGRLPAGPEPVAQVKTAVTREWRARRFPEAPPSSGLGFRSDAEFDWSTPRPSGLAPVPAGKVA